MRTIKSTFKFDSEFKKNPAQLFFLEKQKTKHIHILKNYTFSFEIVPWFTVSTKKVKVTFCPLKKIVSPLNFFRYSSFLLQFWKSKEEKGNSSKELAGKGRDQGLLNV